MRLMVGARARPTVLHKQYAVHAVAMTRLAAAQHKITSAMVSMGALPMSSGISQD